MPEQVYLALGRPSEPPGIVEHTTLGHWHMTASTTWMLRNQWAEDFYERMVYPRRPPITVEDCEAVDAHRSAYTERLLEWRRLMVKEKKATSYGHFKLNEGEKDFERYWPQNAAGKIDARLSRFIGDCRVPWVNVDGEVYRAGARGNDRKVIRAEIMGAPFYPEERIKLLERIDSPQMWDQLICIRICTYKDLGEETERMIREENLTPESRENLLYNLMNIRNKTTGGEDEDGEEDSVCGVPIQSED